MNLSVSYQLRRGGLTHSYAPRLNLNSDCPHSHLLFGYITYKAMYSQFANISTQFRRLLSAIKYKFRDHPLRLSQKFRCLFTSPNLSLCVIKFHIRVMSTLLLCHHIFCKLLDLELILCKKKKKVTYDLYTI